MSTNSKGMEQSSIIQLEWHDINNIILELSKNIKNSVPDIIIAIQRGGLIPSVILSHSLGVREVITYDIRITVNDEVNSEKTSPIVGSNLLLSKITNKDILIVDDISGSGETLKTVLSDVEKFLPSRVRSLVCVINRNNWDRHNLLSPESMITYVGKEVNGWIKFPWEVSNI